MKTDVNWRPIGEKREKLAEIKVEIVYENRWVMKIVEKLKIVFNKRWKEMKIYWSSWQDMRIC